MRVAAGLAVGLAVWISGCLAGPSDGDGLGAMDPGAHAGLSWEDLGGLVFSDDHVHGDREIHTEVARNVSVLASWSLSPNNQSMGEYTEIDVGQGLLAVAVVTGAGGVDVRVVLLDENALPELRVVGSFDEPGAYGDVKIDRELPLVYVPYPGGLRFPDDPMDLLRSTSPTFSIWDVSDPTDPQRVGEAPGAGCHMLHPITLNGVPHVWCTSAGGPMAYRIEEMPGGGYRGVPVGDAVPQSDPEVLRYASYYEKLTPAGPALLMANHDMTAQADPVTGDPVLVSAHELQGIRVFDIRDPRLPVEVSAWRGEGMEAPLERVHTVALVEIDGRRIGIGATETFTRVEPSLYIVDFTDYANPVFLARWTPPGIPSDEALVYSLHNFQLIGTRLYLTNFHAGTWLLDISDPAEPRELALRTPVWDTDLPEDLNSGVIDNVQLDMNWYWDVVVARGYAIVSDMANGVEVLHFHGDPAGDPAWRGFT